MSGLWKKVATWLPYLGGLGSLLTGVASICVKASHAPDAAALVALAKGLADPTNPDAMLIMAGATVLGLHTNHQAVAAQTAAQQQVLDYHNLPAAAQNNASPVAAPVRND